VSLDTDGDIILAGAHLGTNPHHAALALAHCKRVLDGDAPAEVVAALGLDGAA
jgi:hypothetical protein